MYKNLREIIIILFFVLVIESILKIINDLDKNKDKDEDDEKALAEPFVLYEHQH